MKQLLSLANGAVVVNENAGQVSLVLNESLSVGGGAAAGVISVQGAGSVVLSGKQGFDLAMKLLELHSPAALVPFEVGAQAAGDAAISSL